MVDFYDTEPEGQNLKKKPDRAAAVAIEQKMAKAREELLPRITAAGYGALAEKILRIAFDNDVKVREDADLAQMLATLEIDSEIPSEALVAVAEILSYVYKVNGKAQNEEDSSNHQEDEA